MHKYDKGNRKGTSEKGKRQWSAHGVSLPTLAGSIDAFPTPPNANPTCSVPLVPLTVPVPVHGQKQIMRGIDFFAVQ
jgi:hypothetical protein